MDDLKAEVARTIDEVRQVADILRGLSGNTQTIVHRSEGMGAWGAAAVVACFLTYLTLIVFAIYIIPEVHDVKAWNEVLRGKVAKFEAQQLEKKS